MLPNHTPPCRKTPAFDARPGQVGTITGRPHVGKRALTLSLAACMAAGMGAGRTCCETQPGRRVLYLAGRSSRSQVHDQLAYETESWDRAAHDRLEQNLNAGLVEGVIDVRDAASRAVLTEAIREHEAEVVVVDAFRALLPGDQAPMTDVHACWTALQQLIREEGVFLLGSENEYENNRFFYTRSDVLWHVQPPRVWGESYTVEMMPGSQEWSRTFAVGGDVTPRISRAGWPSRDHALSESSVPPGAVMVSGNCLPAQSAPTF